MGLAKQYFQNFVALIYPRLCQACGEVLLKSEKTICLKCKYKMPQTKFHQLGVNPLSKLFWGKVEIQHVTALYFFNKGGLVQKMLHNFKYNKATDVGLLMGETLGESLKESEFFKSIDCIIPVPLHPKKQRKRGFNQSDFIAEGVSKSININWESKKLIRQKDTKTQTKKGLFERSENVENIFVPKPKSFFENKHILLVDDVLTTGSTLTECAKAILQAPNSKVSLATIACSIR